VLLKLKSPFAPIAKEKNCPMLLLSNKKILVTGTWFGVKVHRLVVDGGCDMALFDSLNKIGLSGLHHDHGEFARSDAVYPP